ncbi:hypothetical protein [Hafnia paralvei]|uniref:hypothetical protein n=1 Tax=Hafnia paralvei TaxID=546367 RepID=UPI003C53F75F
MKPKSHDGTDDDANLEGLCWPFHRAKTAALVKFLRTRNKEFFSLIFNTWERRKWGRQYF